MKRTKAKRIICFIVAAAAIFAMLPLNAFSVIVRAATTNASWYSEELHSFSVTQESKNFTSKDFEVSNPIFADGNVSEFNSSTNGWDASTSTSAIMGVVNTTAFDTFKGRQDISKLDFMTENPSSSHTGSPNVLIMANKSATGTSTASFSQKLDEFWADGYFEVKVDFYAVKGVSAIYLIPENEFTDGRALPRVEVRQLSIAPGTTITGPSGYEYTPSTSAIPNLSIWQTATFLVKTDVLEPITFKLSLNLGHNGGGAASGVVYYDNVRVTGHSATKYETIFEQAKIASNNLTCVVDLSKPALSNPPNTMPYSSTKQISEDFNNESTKFKQVENFETFDNTNILPFVRISNIPAAFNMKDPKSNVYGITKPDNRGAMLLSAVDTSVSLSYYEPILINRQEIYIINFYALCSAESVGFFRIRDTRHETLDVPDYLRPHVYNSGFMPVKSESSASSASHNNWVLNTVFVVGEALQDVEVNFEFWVGGSENTTGYMLVDNFSMSRVSIEYYGKHQSSPNVTECDIDWYTPTATIDNANFNIGAKRSNISAFPLVATGWATTLESETVENHFAERRIINGVVNTDPDHWMKNNKIFTEAEQREYNMPYGRAYGTAINPFQIRHTGQNINNNIFMMQNVASTYQSIESNSFTLTSDTRNVIAFDVATHNLSNREVWAVIEIGDREVIRLQLVSEYGNITGVSDWKNFAIVIQTSRFTSPETKLTFELGSLADTTSGTLFIDNIKVHEASTTSGNITVDLNDPSKLYKRSLGVNAELGGESLFFIPQDGTKASTFYNAKSDVLSLSTTGVSNAIIENKMTEVLTEEKAYEYIVRLSPVISIKTDRTYESLEKKDRDALDWGISIRIKDMDGGFENLKIEDFQKMPRVNGLIELRFLIKSGTSLNLALEVEFGNQDVIITGAIGIKGLELREYNDEQFNSAEEDTLTRIITTSKVTTETDDDGDSKKPSLNFLIIPSIITGAAIIFAVIATFIKRSRFRLHIEKQHTSYARDDFETAIPKKDLKAPKAKKAPKKQKDDGENK